jgi:hypothetical protein
MPATRRSASKPRASDSARKRHQENGRVIDRVAKSLEHAQADLSALRGTMGSGASDLRKDITRLVRDARRDVGKLSTAIRRDLERAQKDLTAAAKSSSTRARRGGTRAATSSRSRPRTTRRGSAK